MVCLSEQGTLDENTQLSFAQCRASDGCNSLCPHLCRFSFKDEFSVHKNHFREIPVSLPLTHYSPWFRAYCSSCRADHIIMMFNWEEYSSRCFSAVWIPLNKTCSYRQQLLNWAHSTNADTSHKISQIQQLIILIKFSQWFLYSASVHMHYTYIVCIL